MQFKLFGHVVMPVNTYLDRTENYNDVDLSHKLYEEGLRRNKALRQENVGLNGMVNIAQQRIHRLELQVFQYETIFQRYQEKLRYVVNLDKHHTEILETATRLCQLANGVRVAATSYEEGRATEGSQSDDQSPGNDSGADSQDSGESE